MTDSSENKPTLTDEQVLILWATFIKKWGELVHDQVMADAERCGSLDTFDGAYLRAFWQSITGKLRKLNTDPLPVPAKTQAELDSMWNTIALEFGFPPVEEALVKDVEKRLDFFKRKIAHEFERSVFDSISRHGISSPIEQIFLIQWKYQRVELLHGLVLQPQARIPTDRGTYTVDFIVSQAHGPSARVAIELDGHEFHEKSKGQASRDKQRERAIISTGLPVLRFTGSEVFNNPRRVIGEIIQHFKPNPA